MKALIFAAGLGTRLKPLTDTLPKALIPIAGKPLLEHVILKLKAAGFNEIIVNVHHFPDQIIDFLKANNNFDIRIEVSDERDCLLDTGGGVRNTAWFFDDGKPFLVHNVDILSNLDLKALYSEHLASGSLATLVVSKRDTFRYLLFDDDKRLCGWINEKTGETKPVVFQDITCFNKLAFSGIQMLSPKIFKLMNNLNPKFPIMDFYLSNLSNQMIKGFVQVDFRMMDVGKLDVLDEAERFVRTPNN
ncbi:MAG: nucleotidyltransferase family protein [Paludibacter sp.]|nr:nucleotidyltransferase family protein [Paludibacter sp.]